MGARRSRHRLRTLSVLVIAAGALGVAFWARKRAGRTSDDDAPADVGFMRAIHAALRRDLAHLESVASRLDGTADVPSMVIDGWVEFRDALVRHHGAEDDDLWPILRRHVREADDEHEVDAMVVEHRALGSTLDAVDVGLLRRTGLRAAVDALARVLRDHLEHEERAVLPLLEQHLSRREWRTYLLTERRRTPLRQRPNFLSWVLDDASDTDTAAVMVELPPPARFVYERRLRPAYEAKRHWQLDDMQTTSVRPPVIAGATPGAARRPADTGVTRT